MSAPTPRWGLPTIDNNQAGADVTHNGALNRLDALAIGGPVSVINSTTTAPPGSPVNGDRYLTGTGCSGAWAGHDTQIAVYYNAWVFFVVIKGTMIYDETAITLKLWTGAVWKTITLT